MARRGFGGSWAVCGAALLVASGGPAPGQEARLAAHYGFRPLEIYKLDDRIGGLVVRDLDGDKTDDIAVVNNGRSRIDLLLSRGGKPAPAAAAPGPNAIPS